MRNYTRNALYGTSLLAVSGGASAEIPVSVSTAMATAATDGAAMGALALVVVVAIAAIKYLKRAV